MRLLLFILVSITFFHQKGFTQTHDLRKITSPFIEGSTLYIQGPIDSHIYDYLSYLGQNIKKVRNISLKSYGGSHYWVLEIARKMQELKINTEISEGSFCASACVYLFGSGVERIMSKNSWIGIHGARLSGGYRIEFDQACKIENLDDLKNLDQNCLTFIEEMKSLSLKNTLKAFDLIEAAGVSQSLESHYFSMDDDPLWYEQYNVLKKPDWTVSPQEALFHKLATSIN